MNEERNTYRTQSKDIQNLLNHINQRFGISTIDAEIEFLKIFSHIDKLYWEQYKRFRENRK